jgi:hypothetical protein
MNSAVVDVNINYSNDKHLPCGSIICGSCGYMKNHYSMNDVAVEYHYTCLCLLFESAVICCSRGYCNLLAHVPSVALYTPIPQCTTEDHIDGIDAGIITISREKFDEISEAAIGAKISALANYPYLKSRFLPVQIVD